MDNVTNNSAELSIESEKECDIFHALITENIKYISALFYLFVGCQVITGFVGALGNIFLFYGQLKTKTWPYNHRLLFLCGTCAAFLSSAIHTIQGTIQIFTYVFKGRGELSGDNRWSDVAGDSCHVAVAFSMAALAYQNLFSLVWHSRKNKVSPISVSAAPASAKPDSKSNAKAAIMIICIWVAAVAFFAAGLNPHAEAAEKGPYAIAYISYAVHLMLQVSVAAVLWLTRRAAGKLQVEFATRRAQQSLQMRVHIKETVDLTRTITRILMLHIITWVTSFTVAFIVNNFVLAKYLESTACNTTEYGDGQIENMAAACVGLVDFLALTFPAVYPFVACSRQPVIKKHMKKLACCCRNELQKTFAVTVPSVLFENTQSSRSTAANGTELSRRQQQHHAAIHEQWTLVEKAKL